MQLLGFSLGADLESQSWSRSAISISFLYGEVPLSHDSGFVRAAMTSLMLFLFFNLVLIMLFLVPKVGLLCLPFHLHLLGAYLWVRFKRLSRIKAVNAIDGLNPAAFPSTETLYNYIHIGFVQGLGTLLNTS